MTEVMDRAPVAPEDRQRAEVYDFLAALLSQPPSDGLLNRVAKLEGNDTEFGQAIATLATLAGKTSEKSADREFTALFIGLGRGELLPYASYYMTGFLNEKPLAELRKDMARQSIKRAPNVYEP